MVSPMLANAPVLYSLDVHVLSVKQPQGYKIVNDIN